MPRLPIFAAATAAIVLAVPGCSRNRTLPTQLAPSRTTTIGVNSYLWRAAIDTVSFAPLLQADSNGGVIVTDWFTNPNSPGDRVKITVSILDQDLRADALRVAASRQTIQNGNWVNAPVAAATVQKLEDIILTRARDLRRTAVGG
jgi:alpha-beta hydrolase superfamily lysophospholipase